MHRFDNRNNIFEDCFTSGPEWGEAVITITPSFRPQSVDDAPYHRKIRIENNVFKHFDPAILYARSVGNLVFKGNTIEKTQNYPPFTNRPMFFLDGCRDVLIEDNTYGDDVPGMNIETHHMKSMDLTNRDAKIKTIEDKP